MITMAVIFIMVVMAITFVMAIMAVIPAITIMTLGVIMAQMTIMNVMALLSSMSFAIFDRLFIITFMNMAIVVAMAITAGMATLDIMDITVCMI